MHGDLRIFRVDWIERLEELDERFADEPHQSLKHYIEIVRSLND
jgi:predicted DNA-binding transcriptional regulator YafY